MPKCKGDIDCPLDYGCVCQRPACSSLGITDTGPDEPKEDFCFPLPSLFGDELPPELQDGGLERIRALGRRGVVDGGAGGR